MGFNSVYKALLEVFPDVDIRMLKAVAIEHSKDADSAVEFILSEVLPFVSKQSVDSSPSIDNKGPRGLKSGRAEFLVKHASFSNQMVVEEALAGPSSESVSAVAKDAAIIDYTKHPMLADSTLLDEDSDSSSLSNFYDANESHDRVRGNTGIEESEDLQICQENNAKTGPKQTSESSSIPLVQEICGVNDSLNDLRTDLAELNESVTDNFYTVNHGKSHKKEVPLDRSNVKADISLFQNAEFSLEKYSPDSRVYRIHSESSLNQFVDDLLATSVQGNNDSIGSSNHNSHADLAHSSEGVAYEFNSASCSNTDHKCLCSNDENLEIGNAMVKLVPNAHDHMPDAAECGLNLEFCSGTAFTDNEKAHLGVTVDISPKEGKADEIVPLGDGTTLSAIVTGSGQVCRIDFLEDIIEDAKSNKKTLFSAVESVINLMREVELEEKAAEQAREEASKGGIDILARIEELRHMLQHAKEANDMHAGEVYGEKAILATEARELQARLLGLSDERDKSLAILDELRQTLEGRLAAAAEEKKAAELEKLEKENLARDALAEQELIMEKVVEESKMLHQEAEENSKLREFLMDRGRLVDMLQGEISVICQDVRLLKEKFDERVPLSKSVSSSQTSCILASSSTSQKSVLSDQVAGQADLSELPKNRSPSPSIGSVTPKNRCGDDEAGDNHKALSDDGWDFFD